MYITYHTLAHRLAPRPCDSDIYTWRDSFHLCNSRIPMSWDVTEDPDVRLSFCLITPFFLSVLRGMVLHSIFFQTVWQTQRSASVSYIVLGSSYRFQYVFRRFFPGVGYTSFRLLKEDFGRNHQFLLQIVHCLTLGETIAFLIDRSSAVGDPKQKRRSGLDDW